MPKVKRGEKQREVLAKTGLTIGQIWQTSEPVQILEVKKILTEYAVCRVLRNELVPRKRGTKTHIRLENFLRQGWKKLSLSEVTQIEKEDKPQRAVVEFPKFSGPKGVTPINSNPRRYIARSR